MILLIEESILATDLAIYFKNRASTFSLLARWIAICRAWSHDPNTGLWLVETDHGTWILASDWSVVVDCYPWLVHIYSGSVSWTNAEHKKLVRGLLMTACDLGKMSDGLNITDSIDTSIKMHFTTTYPQVPSQSHGRRSKRSRPWSVTSSSIRATSRRRSCTLTPSPWWTGSTRTSSLPCRSIYSFLFQH